MREILFRGKRHKGEWYYGSYLFLNVPSYDWKGDTRGKAEPVHYIINEKDINYAVDPSTAGQYTGLTDKNGKKIFEGDICRFREWSKGEMCWIGKVHFEHQQFMISGGPNKECETIFELCMSRFIPENIEVIGNIHDNPELLENP